ncbi:PRC-barrel domain-containing protein [Candidatus Peregrinibacteria bacterium]|jgi:sporulation protein YlmC with PRC-barrel domain|nr:PRC-barrel domain-containing protein [Candidatus Peregrinibacteria bacterium]
MQILWSKLTGTSIRDDDNAPCGTLSAVFMNPENSAVLAFLVGISKAIAPTDIEKWGDPLKIADKNRLLSPLDILRIKQFGMKRCLLNGKKVVAKSGKYLGRVQDFTYETESNRILNLTSCRRFIRLEWNHRQFDASDISEIQANTIHLKIDPEQKERVGETAQATSV